MNRLVRLNRTRIPKVGSFIKLLNVDENKQFRAKVKKVSKNRQGSATFAQVEY